MYKYAEMKPKLFTEEGTALLLKVRDRVKEVLKTAGAFRWWELRQSLSGANDDWMVCAALDYLIEKGEIHKVGQPNATQYQIFSGRD